MLLGSRTTGCYDNKRRGILGGSFCELWLRCCLRQDVAVTVKSHASVKVLNDYEHHTIHHLAFVDEHEYSLYSYVESYREGERKTAYQRLLASLIHAENQKLRDEHDDEHFDAEAMKPGLVVACKVARRYEFYVYTAFMILVREKQTTCSWE